MKLFVQRFDPEEKTRRRNVPVRETEQFRTAPHLFPFIVDDHDGAIHEPSTLFLLHHFRNKARKLNGRWKAATAEARAYDLKDWFQLVHSSGLDWRQADDDVMNFYVTSMMLVPSVRTGKIVGTSTIGRRLDSIYKFYDWAKGRFTNAEFDRPSIRATYAHSEIEGEQGDDEDDAEDEGLGPIRPLMPKEYRKLLEHLGPLPSEIEESDLTSCRCRLTVDLAVHTGLRVDEVAQLTRKKIMALRPDPDRPAGACALQVTLTKRLVPRTVRVPNWLVEELHLYDQRERARCIILARTRWLTNEADIPRRFFVNTLASGGDVGKRVLKRSLQDDFRAAVIAADLPTDADAPGEEPRRLHTFHDTRHTFAVWLYAALTRTVDGKPAWWGSDPPWRTVQKQLGHKNEETTTNRYLKFTEGMAADVGDAVVELFGRIRDGQ